MISTVTGSTAGRSAARGAAVPGDDRGVGDCHFCSALPAHAQDARLIDGQHPAVRDDRRARCLIDDQRPRHLLAAYMSSRRNRGVDTRLSRIRISWNS